MNKNEQFWTEHLIDAACSNIGVTRQELNKITSHMRVIGGINTKQSLTKLASPVNAEIAKKIKPYLLEVADDNDDDADDIDEGKIEYHDNTKDMTQNHPNEITNEYATFSVPSGFK